MPERDDLQLLISAAQEAAPIALQHWRGAPAQWDKPDAAGPVSEADIAVDDFLRERLTTARPGWGWLSEETEDTPDRQTAETLFVVDPIDGTRAYLAGETAWALSLAVVRKGRVTAAVVFMPAAKKLYSAAAGQGAAMNGAALTASSRSDLTGATVLAARQNFQPQFWRDLPDVARHFRPSLAYRLSLVGEGRFDAMLTLRPVWEWDVAAGSLIASEAGARVTDRNGGPLQFNSPAAMLDGMVAAPPGLHGQFLNRLAGAPTL